ALALAALPLAALGQGADFGSPPSGEYPILFNDHHVYAKPDTLRTNRVVAALVRGGTILVPLRSMFEQMGATVSYDGATKTVDVSKPGSDVKVTVGKPEVTINGEARPLDVPPIIYNGTVLVPVRVISEGMGAYVQWVPEKKTVVVRYVPLATPAPPPPPPAPTATPAPPPPPQTPAPTPTPSPAPPYYDKFIVGDWQLYPHIYNEFNPGNVSNQSWSARAGIEYPVTAGLTLMAEGDWRHYQYVHQANQPVPLLGGAYACPNPGGTVGCVTTLGGFTQLYAPQFLARDDDLDGRLGIRIMQPRVYIAGSYIGFWNNYGYPRLGGAGVGLEKLPDLNQALTWYASYYYYPSVSGNFNSYTVNGTTYPGGTLSYFLQRYQVGFDLTFRRNFPLYFDFGYQGESWVNKSNAPSNKMNFGFYTGLGLHF
ncbi:MAG: copper amine oxidase N-terminal domain-containing protein, partial [Candidatus Eremiobacteraeota bacterium]|nr:copper amine oxidase N-terminal domain-containing protein [Candidatus Eremiobacteraeota bacterium]